MSELTIEQLIILPSWESHLIPTVPELAQSTPNLFSFFYP